MNILPQQCHSPCMCMCRKFLSQGGAQQQLPGSRAGRLGWLLSGWRGLLVLAVGVLALRKAGLWASAVS